MNSEIDSLILLSDNPNQNIDTLGFKEMVEILQDVIQNLPEAPFTIGVFGEWGCGKTTLMKMVEKRLIENDIKTVWFNAWKYDGKDIIWNALIQQIFYTIKEDPELEKSEKGKQLKKRIKQTASQLAEYASKIAVNFIPGSVIKPEIVDIVSKQLRPLDANDDRFKFINRFESEFDELLKLYLGDDRKYLVIFIDDLDRCLPETAISIMEALKLYLDRSNCIFVIGTESSIIEEGIKQRYKDNERLSGKEYLEKIIQLPFVMRGIDIKNALSMLDSYSKIINHRTDELIRTLIIEGTKCNPRRIKRFINSFLVLLKIAYYQRNSINPNIPNISEEDKRHLAKILLIQMRFPEFYYALMKDLTLITKYVYNLSLDSDTKAMALREDKIFNKFYHDLELRRFLEKTKSISCEAEKIEQWIILTKTQSLNDSSE